MSLIPSAYGGRRLQSGLGEVNGSVLLFSLFCSVSIMAQSLSRVKYQDGIF